MKKTSPVSKLASKNSDAEHALGGQPESDKEARDAGLNSATSSNGAEKSKRGSSAPPSKLKKGK